MSEDTICIPIFGDDGTDDLIRAFLQELHRLEFIHVANGTVGEYLAENVYTTISKGARILK